jgi:putative salt-induced outer membrane protein YdiY
MRNRILFVLVLCLLANSTVTAQTPLPKPAPSWQTGQSNWNGNGYDVPPSTPASGSEGLPAMHELPDEWHESFGLSQSNFQQPVIEPLPLTDPAGSAPSRSMPISEAIAEGATLDQPPLQQEVVRWYQVPWRWMSKGWTNHAEFGLDGSSGNADTLAIQTGLEMKRKTDAYTLALDIDYRQASARSTTTEDNGRLNIDYDRLLGDKSPWTMFGKFGMEFDEFKAFDLRLNINGGLGYYWVRNDNTNIITRLGAGASREIGAPIDKWVPEAVFGFEADHKLSARQKIKAKLDYFPTFEDFSDYRLVADVAWESLIDSSENLSIRLSLTDRYDSTPQGAIANDVYYSALLLYKF